MEFENELERVVRRLSLCDFPPFSDELKTPERSYNMTQQVCLPLAAIQDHCSQYSQIKTGSFRFPVKRDSGDLSATIRPSTGSSTSGARSGRVGIRHGVVWAAEKPEDEPVQVYSLKGLMI
jgi:hypothetical protein